MTEVISVRHRAVSDASAPPAGHRGQRTALWGVGRSAQRLMALGTPGHPSGEETGHAPWCCLGWPSATRLLRSRTFEKRVWFPSAQASIASEGTGLGVRGPRAGGRFRESGESTGGSPAASPPRPRQDGGRWARSPEEEAPAVGDAGKVSPRPQGCPRRDLGVVGVPVGRWPWSPHLGSQEGGVFPFVLQGQQPLRFRQGLEEFLVSSRPPEMGVRPAPGLNQKGTSRSASPPDRNDASQTQRAQSEVHP